jgi:hypothetical protein
MKKVIIAAAVLLALVSCTKAKIEPVYTGPTVKPTRIFYPSHG